ncbi:alpha/beta hydrolase [Aldersonia sp. NBC_00410]|uniref:alpha/beta fold hydrolase n=1 Tax=Aldersonia sp. NBC_00410 TaxID=2975954 RepID=UPI0022574751|nr:alpha/beta hydrolase [Aldersonia sp. NBC_00410]MCX5044155.1 alpha/beta hydrolase [Aldersonia sp. NBC_00410]
MLEATESMVRAGVLNVAVRRSGVPGGWPVVLLHGFPYDPRCFDRVAAILSGAGADVVVPYLRGYGATRFANAATLRSGEQAALGHDLLALIEALELDAPIVAGYDWGGRAACVVSALWPERVAGLVTANGYNIQHISAETTPKPPAVERTLWYQYYLHGDRGKAGLSAYRAEYARQLWQEWSPTWKFDDREFEATRSSFDNPDFVDVVVHSYRHRFGLVDGDPAYRATEARLDAQPSITAPTIVVDGNFDTVRPPLPREQHEHHFTALTDYRCLDVGHNAPQEDPDGFARAITDLRSSLQNAPCR